MIGLPAYPPLLSFQSANSHPELFVKDTVFNRKLGEPIICIHVGVETLGIDGYINVMQATFYKPSKTEMGLFTEVKLKSVRHCSFFAESFLASLTVISSSAHLAEHSTAR